jgi:stage III sporulation protein AE
MKFILIFILSLLLLTPLALAEDVTERSFEIIDGGSVESALPGDARDMMGGAGIDQNLNFGDSIKAIFGKLMGGLRSYLGTAIMGGVKLFAVAVMCGICASLSDRLKRATAIAGTLAVTLIAAGDMGNLIGMGVSTVRELAAFGKVLMPVLAAAAAASGSVGASGAAYLAVMFVTDMIITLIADVMTPLCWAYVALLAAGGATGNEGLYDLAKALKTGITFVLKIIVGMFIGYLTVSGVITGATDALTVKSVKLAASVIPVAGSVISDAAEAVVAGAGIVRGVTGVFGILGIIAMAGLPVLRTALQYLVFRGASLLAGIAGADGMDKLLSGFGDAFSVVLGLTGVCALLLVIGIFITAAGVGM